MTSSLTDTSATMELRPPLWRELWNTTLSYLLWGYGALAFSLVAYGSYAAFKWLAKNPGPLVLVVLVLVPVLTALFSLSRIEALILFREHRFEFRLGAREGQQKPTRSSNTKLPS